jgi:hypothetical protein
MRADNVLKVIGLIVWGWTPLFMYSEGACKHPLEGGDAPVRERHTRTGTAASTIND